MEDAMSKRGKWKDWNTDDLLTGTEGDDKLFGRGGNDQLRGLGGNDWLKGGDGDDLIFGGPGDDRMSGGDGNDHLEDTQGSNVFFGGRGDDTILSQFVPSPLAAVWVSAGEGNDFVHIEDFNSGFISGGAGNDEIIAGPLGNALILGGKGNDVIQITPGSHGGTIIDAGPGDDFIGVQGGQTVTTGKGSDEVFLGASGPLVVTDFTAGANGDVLNLTADRPGLSPLATWSVSPGIDPFADGFLRLVQVGADAILEVDRSGPSNGAAFSPFVTFQNVDAAAMQRENFIYPLKPGQIPLSSDDMGALDNGEVLAPSSSILDEVLAADSTPTASILLSGSEADVCGDVAQISTVSFMQFVADMLAGASAPPI
jgi:hypothetical protein